jgi:hypothetical protein
MFMLFSISSCVNNKDITTEIAQNITSGGDSINLQNNNYRFNTREITGNNDGKNIYGIAYIPVEAGEKVPTVIYSHGYGGTNSKWVEMFMSIAKK